VTAVAESAFRDEPKDVREEDAFDVQAMHRWLADRVEGLRGVPQVRQFGGGASNLTYLLRYSDGEGDRELVLRRPPAGHKSASAHDMRREYRVQERLRPVYRYVPRMLAFCDDPAVIGTDFYVMERLEGLILRGRLPRGLELSPEQARALGTHAVGSLVALHQVDPAAAVLDWEMATLGDPLMDLGGALAYWLQADDDETMRVSKRQPTDLPGMPTREQVVAQYAERTGLAVDGWTFYEVFGLFRLAGIARQIYYRYFHGQTTNPTFEHYWYFVTYLDERCRRIAGLA
jgi:aminoglycoside phosphotransferase (APT) family kinase protein